MYSRIAVRGEDALGFLQGQLTQNVDAVGPEHCPLAAWCSPQGRVVAVMRLLPATDGGLDLVLPSDIAADVRDGLERYRLRARIELTVDDAGWSAFAVANATDIELLRARALLPAERRDAACQRDGVTVVTLDRARTCIEVYGDASAISAAGVEPSARLTDEDWGSARIAAGIADVGRESSGRYTPHMLDLDRLGAVSFDKGCYTGQEIVARTEHRGTVKRRIARFRSPAPLDVGAAVELDGTGVGEVVAAAGHDLLALLPVELHERRLHAGQARLEPVRSD